MKFLFLSLFVIVMISGCGTGSCIKIGGSYQGISGDIEYCFNGQKTEAVGRPVLENTKDASQSLLGITDTDIDKILGSIQDKVKDAIGIKEAKDKKTALVRFLKK